MQASANGAMESDDKNTQLNIDDASETLDETKMMKSKFKPFYAYFVLAMVLMCRMMVQWHWKGFGFAYGYTGTGEQFGDKFFEMSKFYPQLKNWYGLLAGLLYTVPYSFFGLVAGKISDGVNRKLFLGIVIALSGLTMGVSGFASSFAVFSIMRVFSGMLNSASNPLSFSLIADYFPPERRATANSLIQAGNYIGGGLSSLTIILISMYGW